MFLYLFNKDSSTNSTAGSNGIGDEEILKTENPRLEPPKDSEEFEALLCPKEASPLLLGESDTEAEKEMLLPRTTTTTTPTRSYKIDDAVVLNGLAKAIKEIAVRFAIFFAIAWIMTTMQVRSDRLFVLTHAQSEHWTKSDGVWYWNRPLPDSLMELLSSSLIPVEAADWAMNSFIVLGALAAQRVGILGEALIDFLTLMSVNYGLRFFCISVTSLPPSDPRCPFDPMRNSGNEDGYGISNVIGDLISGFNVMMGWEKSCTDKLFSGHTACAVTILSLYLLNCQSKRTRIYAFCHLSATLLLIVACRNHYSVDVVLGGIVSGFVNAANAFGMIPLTSRHNKIFGSLEDAMLADELAGYYYLRSSPDDDPADAIV